MVKPNIHIELLNIFVRSHVLEANTNYIWVSVLTFVEFTINSTKRDTIYSEPFELVFGYLPENPIDRLHGLGTISDSYQFVFNI